MMETIYVRTGNEEWKRITRFWMTLFGINFAIGVATGIILEFEFGTNWSNYSWFVGDIFGAPLAVEGILAFFLESTFVAVMFFGWNKVSKKFHLALNLAGCNRSKSFSSLDTCCKCLDAESCWNGISILKQQEMKWLISGLFFLTRLLSINFFIQFHQDFFLHQCLFWV